MKLLFIIGNSASGKITVGQELCKITPFPNYLQLDNSNISAAEAAQKIKEYFIFK